MSGKSDHEREHLEAENRRLREAARMQHRITAKQFELLEARRELLALRQRWRRADLIHNLIRWATFLGPAFTLMGWVRADEAGWLMMAGGLFSLLIGALGWRPTRNEADEILQAVSREEGFISNSEAQLRRLMQEAHEATGE